MDAHDVVESRLRGMRALLGSIDDPDARRLKSAQQTHVLKVLIVRLNSKAEKHHEFVARVVEALSGLSGIMASEHVDELLVCIAESVPQKACKWSMQDYSSVFAFFTDADWKQWEAATTLDHCRRITFRVAYRLGCRHASEPSTRWWTSVALAKVKELKLLELMQTSELVSNHVKTKSEWKSFVQRIPADDPLLPGRQLNCLHDDAAEFKAMHAEWFEELYKDNLPSPAAKTNLDDAVRVHQLYDCRPGKAAQQMHNGGCGSRGSVLGVDAGSSGALMQVARAITDGIHGLQVRQTQFLDRMSNRSFAQFLDSQEKDRRMRKSPSGTSESLEDEAKTKPLALEDDQGSAARTQQSGSLPSPEDEEHRSAPFGGVLGMLEGKRGEKAAAAKEKRAAAAKETAKEKAAVVKRPAAAAASFKTTGSPKQCLKRPAAQSSSSLPRGWTFVQPYADRPDKTFFSPGGKRYRSMVEVNEALGR